MSSAFLLVQLSDPHLGAEWGHGDPAAKLAAAVEAARALEPDGVLVSGDLADHAADADAEYEQFRDLLERIDAPLHVLVGNHDDRDALQRHFGVPGTGDEPVQYLADLGSWRLVVVDSKRPGEDRGELDPQRLAWLDAALAAAPDTPTVLAMHHPPVRTGSPAWDRIGLPETDRRALGDVLERHPQVRRIVAGHVHRTIAGELAGRAVLAVPSTYAQAEPGFAKDELEFSAGPAGFAVHALLDGQLVSHIQTVR